MGKRRSREKRQSIFRPRRRWPGVIPGSPLLTRVPPGTQFIPSNCVPSCVVMAPLREPPNHVYNFTTVTIPTGVRVKFIPNKANTPVFILATGDVTINGNIDLTGEPFSFPDRSRVAPKGGPGGFSGGTGVSPGAPSNVGGAGNGPGGGAGGTTNIGQSAVTVATAELQPLIGGSGQGGGGSENGGGGGGAILIASSGTIDLGQGSSEAITALSLFQSLPRM